MTRWLNFKLILLMFLTGGCAYTPPSNYARRVVETPDFNLMSWHKLEQPVAELTFYIEGDGHAFNANGFASKDPTPGQTTISVSVLTTVLSGVTISRWKVFLALWACAASAT